jgi:hypothetical protein
LELSNHGERFIEFLSLHAGQVLPSCHVVRSGSGPCIQYLVHPYSPTDCFLPYGGRW